MRSCRRIARIWRAICEAHSASRQNHILVWFVFDIALIAALLSLAVLMGV